jgi:hypothetical protein
MMFDDKNIIHPETNRKHKKFRNRFAESRAEAGKAVSSNRRMPVAAGPEVAYNRRKFSADDGFLQYI